MLLLNEISPKKQKNNLDLEIKKQKPLEKEINDQWWERQNGQVNLRRLVRGQEN